MIVLWQLCAAVGFKAREMKCFKRGHCLQSCLPAAHRLRTYPSSLLGPVINHCALSTQLQEWTRNQAWPGLEPRCPLSTTGPRDGHWASESPCVRSAIGFRRKDGKFSGFCMTWGFKVTFPATLRVMQERSQPRGESQVNWGRELCCSCPMPAFSCM